jgi:endonuclease/exonuclease/phosphatase family metal-dependent hydrolase
MLYPMKKGIKILFGLGCVLVLVFACFLGYATWSDYTPGPATPVFERQDAGALPVQRRYRLMIWNIGYGGLSREMDFFYDGGRQVRPARQIAGKNITAIERFIARQTEIDFFLLQEVDQDAKRSHSIDAVSKLSRIFPHFHSSFGKNYHVFFVPVPIFDPLGHVLSGVQTLSRFEPVSAVRQSFPGNYAWPQGLFMLDRCFLVSRYRLDNGKNLLVINTHNSAYDDGTLRSRQMAYLKTFLIQEYEKGNYVIVGGDWNQCPPSFSPEFDRNLMDDENRMDIERDYLPKWRWAYDRKVPTNRRLVAPYDKRTTLTTVIDFFLVSPNVEIKQVQGIHLEFEHSDHHPVKLEIKLKEKT